MRKDRLKMLALGTLALTILFNTWSISSEASDGGMRILRSHHSDQVIKLRNNPIEIPNEVIQREEQFRGVWVSTVYNLDFPSEKGMSKEKYKAEYISLLDNLEELKMNSVIFQVRPKLDAFYKSNINPWSEYLTGEQGKSPGWDPMEWMIAETHKRDMEFHAWFNPYRVTTSRENEKSIKEQLSLLDSGNWARQNPDYVYSFGGRLYLNPGEPKVIEHINESVMEVVENYNIDAVHFDDYFYPFMRNVNLYFKDEANTFEKHKGEISNIADWRRNNVDNLVEKLHLSIEDFNKKEGKSVQFGISPFAIWGHEGKRNSVSRGEGSFTPLTSSTSYDNQFADTRKWVKENWVDYIAPQVYWTFDEKAAPYGEIVHWWTELVKDTDVDLYIGHANYKISDSSKSSSWKNPEEIGNQLKFNSQYDEIKGSIFFRYKNLLKSKEGKTENDKFIDLLKNEYFKNKAKLPKKSSSEQEPITLKTINTEKGNVIVWVDKREDTKYYAIYRETIDKSGKTIDQIEVKTLAKMANRNSYGYFDKSIKPDMEYKYSIESINKDEEKNKIMYE